MRFEEAYAAFRSEPFPAGSPNEQIDELHADLALADHWVAQSVVPYADHGRFSPAALDVMGELGDLRKRSMALGQDDYVRYVERLTHVYDAFLREGQSSTPD